MRFKRSKAKDIFGQASHERRFVRGNQGAKKRRRFAEIIFPTYAYVQDIRKYQKIKSHRNRQQINNSIYQPQETPFAVDSLRKNNTQLVGRGRLTVNTSRITRKNQTLTMEDQNMEDVLTSEQGQVDIENLQEVHQSSTEAKRQKTDGDNSTTHDTIDLYGDNEYHKNLEASMPPIEETEQDEADDEEPPEITAEEEFVPIGARGKVHWDFALTAVTTDDEIAKQGPGSLTNAVIQVEKMLGVKIQDVANPLGPRELAKQARDMLVQKTDQDGATQRTSAFLIPNPVFELDPTTQQSPGVRVTPEEQRLADAGALEYTFQIELNLKNVSEITVFTQFTNRVMEVDQEMKFLPWYRNETGTLPAIDRNTNPHRTISGVARLRNYLGPYNKTRTRLYGRVKVRTVRRFDEIKQHLVEWLRRDLHWIKADYIQAKRISNIGILLGSYNAVDMIGTRESLEAAVDREIGRKVQIDLKLRRFKCKSKAGRTVPTTAYSVSVDSRQVSEATKGLRAVLHKNCVPPTGRKMSLITRASDDPQIQQKHDHLLAQHHEDIANERKLFRKLGVSIGATVNLQNGKSLTLQQTMCALTASSGEPLFTGVERMGKTDTSLFTTHKKNLGEAKRTLHSLPQVLRRVLTKESMDALGMGDPPQQESEYAAMLQQENEYLDGLLNLKHCTEIDIHKKRKKDDETIGAHTAVSGLTNVSPQTNTTVGSGAWSTPLNMDIDNDEPAATQVTSTLTSTHPDVVRLENETKQQQQTIVTMEKQIHTLQQSVQELVQYKEQEETYKERFNEWQHKLTKQLSSVGGVADDTKERQVTLQNDVTSMKQDLRSIMVLLQGGALSDAHTANLSDKNEDEDAVMVSQHPDPPSDGAGKI